MILTSENLDKLDDLVEALKDLKVNDDEYYVSESWNENDAKVNPARNPKTVTHTSDRKKIKVTDTSNWILQQTLLSNQTLPIFTMKMDPRIGDMIETCGGTPRTLTTPTIEEVTTDAVRSSAWVNRKRILSNHAWG